MRVTLLTFGILRDLLGTIGPLELPAGATVQDLLDRCRSLAPANAAAWSSIAVAVNREYAPATHPLADGDEVALLPPVSGGCAKIARTPPRAKLPNPAPVDPASLPLPDSHLGIPILTIQRQRARLTEDPIDAASIAASLKSGQDGAVVVFDGVVRNNTHGRPTLYLCYEAYPEMALAQMKLLAGQAFAEFPIRDLAIVHRLGRLEIGETSVVVAVASAHRAAAFDACRFLIDTLKKTVPIWKKEFFEDGAVWAPGDPFPPELTAAASAAPSVSKSAANKASAPARKTKPRRPERVR
jgi:MoaE-MoaD fusion protein